MMAVSQNLHPKGKRHTGNGPSHIAKADNAHCFSGKLCQRILPEAEIRAAAPFPVFYRLGMGAHMMAQLQQKRHGKLSHGSRTVGRYVGYHDSPVGGGLYIHNINSGCQNSDEFQRRAFLHDFRGNYGLVGKHGFCALHTLRCQIGRRPVVNRKIPAGPQSIPA